MSEHKEVAVLPVTAFYDRVAWLQFRGAYQEANALRELQMLEDAMTRSLLAVLFWPVAALIGLLLAGGVWFAVWRESRRPRHYLSGAEWQQPALSQNDWQPAARARARRQAEYEWSTMAGEAAYWERQR